ncbi:MAG: isopentenyl transferase family protein [Acidimicrobiales bacterium]
MGATASGKSELALTLARRCPEVEIVSIDSMQVYRGMDVGTAKPSPHERREVPHHLIDLVDPWESFSVARYQRARRRVSRRDRGARPARAAGRGYRPVRAGGRGRTDPPAGMARDPGRA